MNDLDSYFYTLTVGDKSMTVDVRDEGVAHWDKLDESQKKRMLSALLRVYKNSLSITEKWTAATEEDMKA